MIDLIKIQTSRGGKQVVDGRELHDFLEVKTLFKDWIKRMIEYGFQENIDFARLKNEPPEDQTVTNPNPIINYALTLDCAKEISMVQRSEKGKQARQYFIEVEKKYNMTTYSISISYADALRQLAEKVEAQEEMERQLELQRPAVDFYQAVASSTDTMDMLEVSKVLGYGRTKLFAFLREQKITIPGTQNLPYQRYIEEGYFKVIEIVFEKPDKTKHIGKKVLVYQKGVDYINKRIKKFGK